MILYDSIIRPLTTEKTTSQKDKNNQYSFEVHPDTNRVEVRKAVESLFNVSVKKINMVNIKGKIKQRGRIVGKRKDWKKAIVTLNKGERIGFFEGV